MIACNYINKRNIAIIKEILEINKKGNPNLVIFQDFNEIYDFIKYFRDGISPDGNNDQGMKFEDMFEINIFDGKYELIKPDYIAGTKKAISIGTNICGRGTDIKCISSLPLHVIVAYYTPNSRVMEQAFVRTARNGQVGTCRCICLYEEICQHFLLIPDKVKSFIIIVDIKSTEQKKFINYYKNRCPWIFEFKIDKQSYKSLVSINELKTLKKCGIDVN